MGCSTTKPIKDSLTPEKPLASLEYIKLGGVKQCILIRSHNKNNPILLYFHGGPGTSELPLIRHFNNELEKYFTVVYLEQRGTGKSFNKKIFDDSLNIDQFVYDGYELSKYLLKRFNKEKLILVGHSWGTIISTKLALKYPEMYYSYVGIGQVVNMQKGEQNSYAYALDKALESNNQKAIKALKKINVPSYLTISNNSNWFAQLKTERKWLSYYGGVIHNQKNYKQFTKIYLKSSEYSLLDMIKFARGSVSSLKHLWPEIMDVNLLNDHTDFKIPVYFVQGKYDYNCPSELVHEYYNKITAPKKELYIFEESAHNPNFEENSKFNKLIIDTFKNYI